MNKKNKKILVVNSLYKYFKKYGHIEQILKDVTFDVYKEDFFGIIGESGSGKSTIGKCIIRLYSASNGTIFFRNKLISQNKISKKRKKWICHNIQMIFQDPLSSLNPKKNVLSLISEPLIINKSINKKALIFLKSVHQVNRFDRNDLIWGDYLLTNTYLIQFYTKMNKKYEMMINKFSLLCENKKLFSEPEFLEEIYHIFADVESCYQEQIQKIYKYSKGIKKLITKKIKKIEIEESLENFKEENLTTSKNNLKLLDIKAELIKTKNELSDLKENIKIQYCEQNAKLLKSLIDTFLNEIKVVKEERNYTTELTRSLYLKVKGKLLADSLIIFKKISENKYIESNKIRLYSKLISFRVQSKYSSILKKCTLLAKISQQINALEDETKGTDLIGKYRDIYHQINEELTILVEEDFTSTDKEIAAIILNCKNMSNKTGITYERKFEDLKSHVLCLKSDLEIQKSKYKESDDFLKDQKKEEAIKIKYAEYLKNKKIDFIANQKDFKIKNLPLIKSQNEEINKLKKEYIVLSLKFDIIIKKMNFFFAIYINKNKLKRDVDELIKLNLNKTELNNSALNLKSYFFEFNVQMDEINLYRTLRSRSYLILLLNIKQLKTFMIRAKVYSSLNKVGLKNEHAYRYPHEFSGGQRQRIVIARALIAKPKLIIADEPISALDVSIQAQVVNIMKKLSEKNKITFIFIAHDLSMVNHVSNRMIILHKGKIVEKGDTKEIFKNPVHPYTISLINASPELSKIHVDLASFGDKNDYDLSYNENNLPQLFSVSDEFEHFVLATEKQIKKWIKK